MAKKKKKILLTLIPGLTVAPSNASEPISVARHFNAKKSALKSEGETCPLSSSKSTSSQTTSVASRPSSSSVTSGNGHKRTSASKATCPTPAVALGNKRKSEASSYPPGIKHVSSKATSMATRKTASNPPSVIYSTPAKATPVATRKSASRRMTSTSPSGIYSTPAKSTSDATRKSTSRSTTSDSGPSIPKRKEGDIIWEQIRHKTQVSGTRTVPVSEFAGTGHETLLNALAATDFNIIGVVTTSVPTLTQRKHQAKSGSTLEDVNEKSRRRFQMDVANGINDPTTTNTIFSGCQGYFKVAEADTGKLIYIGFKSLLTFTTTLTRAGKVKTCQMERSNYPIFNKDWHFDANLCRRIQNMLPIGEHCLA
jgi:hypothetical protein